MRELVFPGSAAKIPELLAELSPRKLLLVHRGASFSRSGAADLLKPLMEKHRPEIFSGFDALPRLEDLERGLASLGRGHDLVLAVGGGAALDMGKLLALFLAQDEGPRACVLEGRKPARPAIPLVAVPTTAGSGSEATHFAVCYANGQKYSVAHESMRPLAAVVDGELSLSMPRAVAASTGLDALSQAIESFWSVNSTKESRRLAREALVLVLDHAAASVNEGRRDARAAMAAAAHLAGKAIDVSRTTTPHALSYDLTLRHGVAHGHAVGLTLGELLEFNARVGEGRCADPRGAAHVMETMAELLGLLKCRTPEDGKRRIWAFMDELGLERSFRGLGIGPEEFKAGLARINWERARNNPREHTLAELEPLFEGRF